MSLFLKPINEINYKDIIIFCEQQNPEGNRIEYKREFPDGKKLAKEIAAFANTNGGIIIIGFNDQDRKPILPPNHISYERGLDERINNICLSNINPPVFPEVQVCQNPDNAEQALVVIRIAESDETPHRVDQDRKIYVRIASQSEPQEAQWEEIEWLQNRRKKALDNKQRLIERAYSRFKKWYITVFLKYGVDKARDVYDLISIFDFFHIYALPVFPSKQLIKTKELIKLIFGIQITNNIPIAYPPLYDNRPLNESIISLDSKENFENYHEFNEFGLIFSSFRLVKSINSEYSQIIELVDVFQKIYLFYLFARKIYNKFGYWGIIESGLFFGDISKNKIYYNHNIFEDLGNSPYPLDSNFEIIKTMQFNELEENFEALVVEIFEEVMWSLQIKMMPQYKQYLNESMKIFREYN